MNSRPPRTASRTISKFPFGRQPGHDAGTDGDVFVDGVDGLDTNDGLSPETAVRTIERGRQIICAMEGDRTMRIMGDGVKYREAVTTNSYNPFPNPKLTSLTVKGYGTDLPWVSGAEIVRGFAPCSEEDAAILGDHWRNVFKATFPADLITGHKSYWRMMTTENGVPLKLAQVRGNEKVPAFFLDSVLTMMSSATDPTISVALNDANQIAAITHRALLPKYTDRQLEQAVAAVHVFPNFVRALRVDSVSDSVLHIEPNTFHFGGSKEYHYNLLNLAPEIEKGGWAYRLEGGRITLYVWPRDLANLKSGIEVAARKFAWKHSNNTRAVHFENIGFEMCANDRAAADGILLNLNYGDNITVSQCHFRLLSGEQNQMLYVKWGNNIRVEYCTFELGQGTYGCNMDGPSAKPATGNRLVNCFFSDLSFTPSRHQKQSLMAVANNYIRRTSAAGHANTNDFKGGCDRCLCLGLVADMSEQGRPYQGYATNQQSSRILYIHSVLPTNSDGRAYMDQTTSRDVLPHAGGDNALINCWVPHERDGKWTTFGAIMVGRTLPASNWLVLNCIAPTIVAAGGYVFRRNNLLTDAKAKAADTSETVLEYRAVYSDPDNRNWAAKSGSPLDCKKGYPVAAILQQWEEWFPDVDFRHDPWGRAWDTMNPGIGPWGRPWAL